MLNSKWEPWTNNLKIRIIKYNCFRWSWQPIGLRPLTLPWSGLAELTGNFLVLVCRQSKSYGALVVTYLTWPMLQGFPSWSKIPRKIEFPLPDEKTKRRIFGIHTGWYFVVCSICKFYIFQKLLKNHCIPFCQGKWPWLRMLTLKSTLCPRYEIDHGSQFNHKNHWAQFNFKDDLSGADIKAICTEAGLLALRERRMKVEILSFDLFHFQPSSPPGDPGGLQEV